MEAIYNKTVGQIVAEDYRTAVVFEKFGIDFCCKGNKSVADACQSKDVNPDEVFKELSTLSGSPDTGNNYFNAWPLDKLAEYIESAHHRYVEEKIPIITRYLNKVCSVHGLKHPELNQIALLFMESATDLMMHMKKEEFILFPRIKQMVLREKGSLKKNVHSPMNINAPVKMMLREHEQEGERFQKIEALTNNYQPPADACNTFRVTYALLKEFQEDLHRHIHLENNLLFPKAIELEERFLN